MTFYIFHNQNRDEFEPFCFFEKAFTEEECDQIVKLGDSLPIVKSYVGDGSQEDISDIRKSKNSWISFEPDTGWLYDKLGSIVIGANEARYKFQLTGFMEQMQYTVYDEHGAHYKLHQDCGKGKMAQRKLSAVLILSNPDEYEDGELEFFDIPTRKFEKGTLVVFPAFQVHGVRPVTSGVRKSLVVWISGEPFR